jgi:hypothetical protein
VTRTSTSPPLTRSGLGLETVVTISRSAPPSEDALIAPVSATVTANVAPSAQAARLPAFADVVAAEREEDTFGYCHPRSDRVESRRGVPPEPLRLRKIIWLPTSRGVEE